MYKEQLQPWKARREFLKDSERCIRRRTGRRKANENEMINFATLKYQCKWMEMKKPGQFLQNFHESIGLKFVDSLGVALLICCPVNI